MADSLPRPGEPDFPGAPDDTVAELRQRLAFYEGFDEIIRDNVARSGELLRQAEQRDREAARAVAEARAEGARRAAAQQRLLAEMASEVAGLRGALDALAGRLAEAASRVEEAGGAPRPAAPAAPASAAPGSAPTLAPMRPASSDGRAEPAPPEPWRGAAAPTAQPQPEPRSSEFAGSLIVHGVGGVEEARRIQAALRDAPGVAAVAAREFAQGVLRLEVAGAGPGVDLPGWAARNGLEVVEAGPTALVARAPGTSGL